MWGSAPPVSAPSQAKQRAPTQGHPCKRKGGRSWKRFDTQKTEAGNNRPQPKRDTKKETAFDPSAFASKLAFTDEVAELGISEEDATRLQIGFTRRKVYFPVRNDDGSISGFIGFADGQLKMPPQWIGTNVVKLKRA